MFKIEKFNELRKKYFNYLFENNLPQDNISMTFTLIFDYFNYTSGSYINYQENLKEFLENMESESVGYQLVSSIFGIYTNGCICLDIASRYNKEILKDNIIFKNYRKEYKAFATAFRHNRNTVTAHPTNNNGLPDYTIELSSYGNGGAIFYKYPDIYIKDKKEDSKFILNPEKDIKLLTEYLEGISGFYHKSLEEIFR